ncbi:MAG: hypothetical protein WCY89_02820 [Flavobacteriaceae bacterium]
MIFSFFIFTNGFSQEESKTIQFEIYEMENYPLPAVTIIEKGTENGTQTDLNGKAQLNIFDVKNKISTSFFTYFGEFKLIKKEVDLIKVYFAERKVEYYKNGKRIKKKRLKH